jgi:hypothetical protein
MLKLIYDRQSVGQSLLVSGSHLGPMTRFLFSVWRLWVSWCGAPSFTRGWVCNLLLQLLLGLPKAVTLGSKSRRTHDHILQSHLRLPQLWGPGPRIYIPQEQGDPVIPPGTWVPFCRLLQLDGLRWRYSNLPPHRVPVSPCQSQSHVTSDGQSVSMSWCQVHSGTCDQILFSVWNLLCCLCGAPSLMRRWVYLLSVSVSSI